MNIERMLARHKAIYKNIETLEKKKLNVDEQIKETIKFFAREQLVNIYPKAYDPSLKLYIANLIEEWDKKE